MLQKSYLEYEEKRNFGVVVSFPSDVLFDATGKLGITGALDEIVVYNIRQGAKLFALGEKTKHKPAQVARLALYRGPGELSGNLLAAGYTDGVVRVWNLAKRELVTRFDGHKSEITALAFNSQGTQLVTGSKDTDVILWDLFGDKGLIKFRGHKNIVTDVFFVETRGSPIIVSSSKDRLIKVWDIQAQHCVQTVVGHSSEIWTIAVSPNEQRIISASNENELRVYKILSQEELESLTKENTKAKSEKKEEPNAFSELESERRIEFIGTVQRKVTDRPNRLKFTSDGSLFALQNAAKTIELFNVHTDEEIKKKMKRRRKREKEKLLKKKGDGDAEVEPEAANDAELLKLEQIASDEFSSKQILRTESKILSFDFEPSGRGKELLMSFYNNSIELYHRKKQTAEVVSTIALPGHRSDIRWAALSSRDEMLMSTSKDELKIWNVSTCNPIRTIPSGYGLCGIFAPGDRHVVIGTKTGAVELYDLHGATLLESNTTVHSQSVFALEMKPDKTGFVTVSADKKIAFWDFSLIDNDEGTGKRLSLDCVKEVEMTEGMFCAKFSKDGKYLAVSLLDYTVKIYFADSMKFFLSLYGHKLPVMTMDISSDSTLIVTGSADKNVKIWGLDFGDCHKSLFAHDDSVMRVAFIPETHMFISAGKDGVIKYWDADRFEQIMTLEAHQSEVWALAMSSDGQFFISGGHDRSLRYWNQSDNPVFVDDQREQEMEEGWEKTLENEQIGDRMELEDGDENKADAAPVVRKTLESIKDAEKIIEALDLVLEQQAVVDGYTAALAEAEKNDPKAAAKAKKENKTLVSMPELSPMLLGMSPSEYLLYVITRIRPSNLESALVVLTFSQVLTLLKFLEEWIRLNKSLMLCSRVLFTVIRMHQVQISANRSLKATLESLRDHTRKHLSMHQKTIQYNLAAMDHLRRMIDDNDASDFFQVSEKLSKIRKDEKKKLKAPKKNYWEESSDEGKRETGDGMDLDDSDDDIMALADDSDD